MGRWRDKFLEKTCKVVTPNVDIVEKTHNVSTLGVTTPSVLKKNNLKNREDINQNFCHLSVEERTIYPFIRSYEEIKQAGLEKYYRYFAERLDIHKYEGKFPETDIHRQAMNDVVYQFMEDHSVDQSSMAVNLFIKKMIL
jgi:hypothetical protein